MIDLHCHSVFSDGTNTPEELVEMAEQAGLSALALTDHDTTEGLGRFFKAADGSSVEAVAGIELSAHLGMIPLHILGYFFDPESGPLQEALNWVQKGRAERNEKILKKLNALGYELAMDDVLDVAGDGVVGRPHFTAVLLKKGYFKRPEKIYRQLLGKGKAAYVDRDRMTPEQCVELISKAGGVSVIAHPGQMRMTRNKLRRLVRRLIPHGLGGLEVLHPSHQPHQTHVFERICVDFELVSSGGTDFHGRNTPGLSLGKGGGALNIPDVLLENIWQFKIKNLLF